MRITHEIHQAGIGFAPAGRGSLEGQLVADLNALSARHPLGSVLVHTFGRHSSLHLRLAERNGRVRHTTSWKPSEAGDGWVGRMAATIARALPEMREIVDAHDAKRIVVERCSAIVAARHVDGRTFRRRVVDALPYASKSPGGRCTAVAPHFTDEGDCSITIPNVATRELRVQVKTNGPGYGLVDRTITLLDRVSLPDTLMNALGGNDFDRIAAGTPFEGHGVVIEKGWRNGKGAAARLSLMARSEPMQLDAAVALIDRLRRPARLAA